MVIQVDGWNGWITVLVRVQIHLSINIKAPGRDVKSNLNSTDAKLAPQK